MNTIIIFFINLFEVIYYANSISLKVCYFKEAQKLYYVNCMNNNDGDLYFEYWGEQNNNRYFTGIKKQTGEEIYFGSEKIKRVTTSYSAYHASMIIYNNNQDNIFSINVNKNYFELISLNNGVYSYKTADDIFDIDTLNKPSFRNSIIKLSNNNYLLSVILYKDAWIDHNNVYMLIFNFNSNHMDNFNKVKKYDSDYGFIIQHLVFKQNHNILNVLIIIYIVIMIFF